MLWECDGKYPSHIIRRTEPVCTGVLALSLSELTEMGMLDWAERCCHVTNRFSIFICLSSSATHKKNLGINHMLSVWGSQLQLWYNSFFLSFVLFIRSYTYFVLLSLFLQCNFHSYLQLHFLLHNYLFTLFHTVFVCVCVCVCVCFFLFVL